MSSVFDPSKLNLDPNKPSEPKNEGILDSTTSNKPKIETPIKSEPAPTVEPKKEPVVDILETVEVKPDTKIEKKEDVQIINEAEVANSNEDIKPQESAKPIETVKNIIDINLKSLDDMILLLNDKQYDFATIVPGEDDVKVSFKKDKIEKEVKYIKFPTYNTILVQIKQAAKLKVEISQSEQEGK